MRPGTVPSLVFAGGHSSSAHQSRTRSATRHARAADRAENSRNSGRGAGGALARPALDRTPRPGRRSPDPRFPTARPAPIGEHGTFVLDVRKREESFRLNGIDAPPFVSLLRGFSAPVKLDIVRSDEELTVLLAHDPIPSHAGMRDSSSRWPVSTGSLPRAGPLPMGSSPADPAFIEALRSVLRDSSIDGAFAAELLTLPSEGYLAERTERIDVEAIHLARRGLRRALGEALANDFERSPKSPSRGRKDLPFRREGRRSPRTRQHLSRVPRRHRDRGRTRQCLAHFRSADNMTDAVAALGALANLDCEERTEALARFEERWRG